MHVCVYMCDVSGVCVCMCDACVGEGCEVVCGVCVCMCDACVGEGCEVVCVCVCAVCVHVCVYTCVMCVHVCMACVCMFRTYMYVYACVVYLLVLPLSLHSAFSFETCTTTDPPVSYIYLSSPSYMALSLASLHTPLLFSPLHTTGGLTSFIGSSASAFSICLSMN